MGLLPIPAGHFVMGDSEGDANEAPRAATVKPFRLMRHEVTNRQFDAFVARTNHLIYADSYFQGCPVSPRSGWSSVDEILIVIGSNRLLIESY